MAKTNKTNYKVLAAFILLSQLAGVIGSIFTSSAIKSWYVFLNKPDFSPPNWVFGPVWITLYTLMGIGAYLVWRKKGNLFFFYAQLFANTLWSIIFFGFKMLDLAFFEILFLLVLIIYMSYKFYFVDKKAAYLQIPYILWVTFATILNYYVWQLNL